MSQEKPALVMVEQTRAGSIKPVSLECLRTGRDLADDLQTGMVAAVNMDSLRRHREEVNFAARQTYMPMHIFRKAYETEVWSKDSLLDRAESEDSLDWQEIRRQVVEQRRDLFARSRQGREQTSRETN